MAEGPNLREMEQLQARLTEFTTGVRNVAANVNNAAQELLRLSQQFDQSSSRTAHFAASVERVSTSIRGADLSTVRLSQSFERMRLGGVGSEAALGAFQSACEELQVTNMELAQALKEDSEAAGGLMLVAGATGQKIKTVMIPAMATWATKMSSVGGGSSALLVGLTKLWTAFRIGVTVVSSIAAVMGGPFTVAFVAVAALIALVAVGIGQVTARFKEAQGSLKAFGGTMALSEVGVGKMTGIFMKNAAAMADHGVEAEELNDAYAKLTSSYGLSADGAKRFGLSMSSGAGSLMDYADASTAAIVNTVAMGKVTGLTNEQTTAWISSLGIVGEDISKADNAFAKLSVAASQSSINVAELVAATTTLNNVNVFVRDGAADTVGTLQRFADSITYSNSALLDGVTKSKLAADAVRAIADASSNLKLPQILAFSGALDGMSGSMDSAMHKAMKMDRAEIFEKALGTITAGAAPGEREFIKTMAAMSLGVDNLNTATAIGAGQAGRSDRSQAGLQKGAATRQDELLTLQRQAVLSQERLEKWLITGPVGAAAGKYLGTPVTTAPSVAGQRGTGRTVAM